MANKGEGKSEKRLAADKVVPLLRKKHTWHVRAKPGPHKKRNSVARGFVLRDMIGIAKNAKEAKKILLQIDLARWQVSLIGRGLRWF